MNRAALGLLLVGLLQISGELLMQGGLRSVGQLVQGIGAATTASPAPKVFSAVQGFETYSTRFTVGWTDTHGEPHALDLTPEVYSRLRGPYNRRNVYGAALAYGPVLARTPHTQPMFAAVTRYALCGPAPMLHELGLDPASMAGPVRLHYTPIPGTRMDAVLPRVLEVSCP
jgi:hypothetical protein